MGSESGFYWRGMFQHCHLGAQEAASACRSRGICQRKHSSDLLRRVRRKTETLECLVASIEIQIEIVSSRMRNYSNVCRSINLARYCCVFRRGRGSRLLGLNLLDPGFLGCPTDLLQALTLSGQISFEINLINWVKSNGAQTFMEMDHEYHLGMPSCAVTSALEYLPDGHSGL